MKWKKKIKEQLKEATKRRAICNSLKEIVKKLLEFDSEFIMVFNSARNEYTNIILKDDLDREALAYFLKNYNIGIYKSLKNNKRLL